MADMNNNASDEFNNWIKAVVDGISGENMQTQEPTLGAENICDYNDWDCPKCFPDDNNTMQHNQCPECGHDLSQDSHACDTEDDFYDLDDGSEEIVIMASEFADEDSEEWTKDEDGQESPLSFGSHNIGSGIFYENAHPMFESFAPIQMTAFKNVMQGTRNLEDYPYLAEKIVKYYNTNCKIPKNPGNLYEWVSTKLKEDFGSAAAKNTMRLYEFDIEGAEAADSYITSDQDLDRGTDPATMMEPDSPEIGDPTEDTSELISKIQYMQDMGLSASNHHYDTEKLMNMSPELIKRIYDKVTGNIHENIYADNSENVEMSPDTSEADDMSPLSNEPTEECASDMLSPIEKKIAIAKAALDRKKSGIEEDDAEEIAHDHGLRSLGNKIVNAKMKHAGVAPTIATEEENDANVDSNDVPDPEIMEWVARFAKRDNLIKENSAKVVQENKPVAKPLIKQNLQTNSKIVESNGVDAETMEWMERLKKVAR